MKAIVPKTFRTGAIVDSEDVNANLQAMARDLQRLIDQRYTYSTISVDISGIVNTDTASERTVPFRPSIDLDVVGVELSVYGGTNDTWALTVTDPNGTVVAVSANTVSGAEGYGSSNIPLQVLGSTRLDFVLSSTAAATITRGTVTLHVRADRHFQNGATGPDPYLPTLIDASTSTAATAINAELASVAAKRALNFNPANQDERGACIAVDNLSAAQTWRLPTNEYDVPYIYALAVGGGGRSVAITDGVSTITLNTTGTSDIVEGGAYFGLGLTLPGDPTDSADDLVLTLTPTGGAISRVYLFLWWS